MDSKSKQALIIVQAIAETIRSAGSCGIVSGHLYAHLMGRLTIDRYQDIIDLLKRNNLISESNYTLTWINQNTENAHV